MAGNVTMWVATRNLHKVEEIKSILGSGYEVWSLNDLPDSPVLVEEASTFEENAVAKAVQFARHLQDVPKAVSECGDLWVLADDSGLEVDALGGAPGVYSARFAHLDSGQQGNASDASNNAKLSALLDGLPMDARGAQFRCVLALVRLTWDERKAPRQDPAVVFVGICRGKIGFEGKGTDGFGYDPWFFPEGYGNSFAELGDETKNQLSHRYKALTGLKAWLSSLRE